MDSILKASLLPIFLVALVLGSCQRKESITPFANPTTLAQSQGRDPVLTIVNGAFTFDELDITNPVGDVPVPILGDFLHRLATGFADLFILLKEDWEVEQEPILVDIPDIDTDVFINLSLKHLAFNISGASEGERASLNFIQEIQIFLANEEMLAKGEKVLAARYVYDEVALKRCKEKCLSFGLLKENDGDRENSNLMPILNGAKTLFILPTVKINSVPKTTFRIRGEVDFKLGFKAPF